MPRAAILSGARRVLATGAMHLRSALFTLLTLTGQAVAADSEQARIQHLESETPFNYPAAKASTPITDQLWMMRRMAQEGRYQALLEALDRIAAQPDAGTLAQRLELSLYRASALMDEGRSADASAAIKEWQAWTPGPQDLTLKWRLALMQARIDTELSLYDIALKSLQGVRTEAETAQQPYFVAQALLGLARVQLDLADYQKGLSYHSEALAIAPPWAQQTRALAMRGQAQMMNMLGQGDQALRQLEAPLATFQRSGNLAEEAYTWLLRGFFLARLGRTPDAITAHRQALALRETLGAKNGIINSLTHLCAELAQLKRYAEAKPLCERALSLAQSTDSHWLRQDAMSVVSDYLAAKGQYQEAWRLQVQALRNYRSHAKADLRTKSAMLREQLESERTRMENQQLNERLAFEQREHRVLVQGATVLALLSVMLTGALFLLFRLYSRTRQLAHHDGLTGLPNRRAVLQYAQSELARAHRYQLALSVMAFDLDHFKRINDEFGHAAGDSVLKALADLGLRNLRRDDRLGRIGARNS